MYLLPMIFSLFSIFLGTTFWPSVDAASPTPTKHNNAAIIERANAYLKAVLAGDVEAVTAKFDDDAILMVPNQPLLRGRLDIQYFYEGWCHGPMKPTAFAFDHLEAIASGDYAYDVGTYKLTMLVGPGRNVSDNGKYTTVLKHSDGEWKIAYLIFNSDLPPHPPVANSTR
jgi:uncharacterized protein (TIGR02246 family)